MATVAELVEETSSARTIVFDVPRWKPHCAGQHLDLRLTAPDGYQATRSYSLSSGPDEAPQITVERVEDGDTLEIRGAVGGYFVWTRRLPSTRPAPLLLIGGGSGIAPLRAMWRSATTNVPTTILYSARTHERVIYRDELAAHKSATVKIHLTRQEHDGYETGRIDSPALKAAVGTGTPPHTYVCGPTAFVEAVTQALMPLHPDASMIRTERFG